MNRKFIKLGLVAALPLSVVSAVALTGGAASAKAASETIHCTTLTATITFNPDLVPNNKSAGYNPGPEQTTISNETIGNCTGSPAASPVTAATSATATVPAGKGNDCKTFSKKATKSKFQFNTTWNANDGTNGNTSVGSFKGAKVITSPSPGFQLSKGTITGAFPLKKKATIQAFLDGPSISTFAACQGGTGTVHSLTINSGNLTA